MDRIMGKGSLQNGGGGRICEHCSKMREKVQTLSQKLSDVKLGHEGGD